MVSAQDRTSCTGLPWVAVAVVCLGGSGVWAQSNRINGAGLPPSPATVPVASVSVTRVPETRVSVAGEVMVGVPVAGVSPSHGFAAQATTNAAGSIAAGLPNAPGLCTLEGTVRDLDGGVVPDARVTLSGEGDAPKQDAGKHEAGKLNAGERAVLTDADGDYILPDVPCHHFELTVTRTGFLPAVLVGSLSGAGETEQQDVVLKMAGANASVTVMATQREIAAAQVHIQEQQRLIGVFPNFFVSYQWNAVKLTPKQKLGLAWHVVRDPVTLGQVALTAGIQQATNSLPGYGSGAAGYGRRFGSGVGNTVAGVYLGGAVLPIVFRQDPRYFYRGTGTGRSRLWYAVSRVFVTRTDAGRNQTNYSGLLGEFGGGALGNLWAAPEDRQGARLTLENGAISMASDAFNNVLQELVLRHFTTRKGGPGKAGSQP